MWEDPPVSNRTRILFAIVGTLACLAAGLVAELAMGRLHAASRLERYHAASLLYLTSPETTRTTVQDPPPELTDLDLQRRLDKEGARSGDIQISLTWNNRNDLDLSCEDPNGETIDGYNQQSRSGGVMDVDMNPTDPSLMTLEADAKLLNRGQNVNRAHRTSSSDTEPIENIYWAQDAPAGHYKVFVHQFCNKERVDRTPFWIVVRARGEVHRIAGEVGRDDFAEHLIDPKLVYEFDVPAAKVVPAPAPAAPPTPPPPPPTHIITHVAYSLSHLDFALLTAGLWGALLGLLPLALLAAQRTYLRQPLVYGEQDLIVALGGPGTGILAALLGQTALSLLASAMAPDAIRIPFLVSWILLGGLFGGVISLFTPNLPRIAAPIAGVLSALAGSAIFLALAPHGLDPAARVLTASLIGGAIGALIALPEREPDPEPEPEPARREVAPPFIVRGTRTRKVGGLRRDDRGR